MLLMRRAAAAALAAILIAGGALAPVTSANRAALASDAVIDAEITQPISANWATAGGNLTSERYSTLDQISTWNVQNLTAKWMIHLGSGVDAPKGSKGVTQYSLEATPIEQNGVLYIPTGADDVFALNAVTGARIWAHYAHLDPKITTVCCGWDNRGVALGQGLVFSGQLDGKVVALSQKTGKLVWSNHLVNWQDGYGFTAAPVYYNGVIYIGAVGGEFGTRGRVYALAAATGKELWRFYTIPGPHDLGGDSWPNDGFAYLHGGATVWDNVAIDPQLGLVYFTTGNAGPDLQGGTRPGDNLFASSFVALHLGDGSLAWYYQTVHHDIWDFDQPSPPVLFDVMYHGKLRKAIAEVGKTGWVYILDRTNGKPLIGIPEKPVPQYAPEATSKTQPYPIGDATIPQCAAPVKGFLSACIFDPVTNIDHAFAPMFEGGTVQSVMAYSPQTQYLYVAASIWPFDGVNNSAKPQPYKKGEFYFGTSNSNTLLGARRSGTLTAINATTNKIAWQLKTKMPLGEGSGTMATAGGLVFNGQPDGWFRAYDARTGKLLWQWQTGYGADAPAMTYDVNGTQYVVIAAGGNSLIGSRNGDSVWAFALKNPANPGRIPQAKAPKAPWTVQAITGTPAHTNKVSMFEYGYAPLVNGKVVAGGFGAPIISVPVGSTVTWTNTGTVAHTSTSGTGGWNTGLVQPGGSATTVMKKTGTFVYNCIPHPWMIGEVIVTPK